MKPFGEIIMQWFAENSRTLPWRETKDAYRIWISEIILQQTRVVQGYDYYLRFMKRFPTVVALAEASEDEVLKCWQGLGYYSRARNLSRAAKSIVESGGFPTDYDGVRALKGVGDYTAAAICSFAYDMPYAVVDGNVYRVLSRWLGLEIPIDTTEGKKFFTEYANRLMDKKRPSLYNQSIMELGALQCIPKNPHCEECPLVDGCVAYREKMVELLPVKQHKTKVVDRFFNYLFVRAGDYTYLNKRTGNDIWKNLYELPLIETPDDCPEARFYCLPELHAMIARGEQPVFRCLRRGLKHQLSHRLIHAVFYEVVLSPDTQSFASFVRVPMDEVREYPVSQLINNFINEISK